MVHCCRSASSLHSHTVTSNFLHVPGVGNIFLDAGEGSLGQLYRLYDAQGVAKVLRETHLIFVSHPHADHHLGVVRILLARQRLLPPPSRRITVVAPRSVHAWLCEYAEMEPLLYEVVDTRLLAHVTHSSPPASKDSFLMAHGLTVCVACPVVHCPHSYGLVLGCSHATEHCAAWKVVFSGDTRPCLNFVHLRDSHDADLVIHEATFEDDMLSEAVARQHSTTTEAIAASDAMHARFLMMNHFSQRYPKIPIFTSPANSSLAVGIAFDLMSLPLSLLPRVAPLIPLLRAIFLNLAAQEGVAEGNGEEEDENESGGKTALQKRPSADELGPSRDVKRLKKA